MSASIALQLYSVRSEPEVALPRVLERMAEIGFHGVEPAGLWGRTPAEFRRCCEAVGLRIAAVHQELPFDSDVAAPLAEAAELGVRTVVLPLVSSEWFGELDRIARLAEQLNRIARVAARAGLRLGYHNHDWEFSLRPGGIPAHRRLFDALDPQVFAEIDVYWAQVGGADPAWEIGRLGARAHLLHLKDGPAEDDVAPMTALGEGKVDLARVLERSQAQWHIVEIDQCAGDLWDTIAASHAFLARTHAASGSR